MRRGKSHGVVSEGEGGGWYPLWRRMPARERMAVPAERSIKYMEAYACIR